MRLSFHVYIRGFAVIFFQNAFFLCCKTPNKYLHLAVVLLCFINFLSKSNGIKLILHRPVETLTNTVGLWTFGFGFGMVNIFNSQIKLIFMVFPCFRNTHFLYRVKILINGILSASYIGKNSVVEYLLQLMLFFGHKVLPWLLWNRCR